MPNVSTLIGETAGAVDGRHGSVRSEGVSSRLSRPSEGTACPAAHRPAEEVARNMPGTGVRDVHEGAALRKRVLVHASAYRRQRTRGRRAKGSMGSVLTVAMPVT